MALYCGRSCASMPGWLWEKGMDGVLGGIILGWLLGLLSPLIVDGIRRRRDAKSLRVALRSEFDELSYRLLVQFT